jgi:hypothetical protein
MRNNRSKEVVSSQPLSGLVVVEIGHSVAAPFAGHVLGDLGATVIKIENPDGGDDTRSWGPPFLHGTACTFQALNRNKHSAAIDLKDQHEYQSLYEFITKKADIVLQNMRPGLVAKLKLDSKSIRTKNKAIIYCNMHAFGANGPLQNQPGYDPLMQAFGGIMSVTGEPGGPPVRVGPSLVDVGTGMWAVIGILSALHRRSETGEGCEIDTSLFETSLSWMQSHIAAYMATGNVPSKRGTELPTLAPYKIFKAADDYLMIAAGNDNIFERLAIALNCPQWLKDIRFMTNPERVQNRELVNSSIEDVIKTKPRDEWEAILRSAGVPCAPLQTLDQVIDHPQTKALGILQTTADGSMSLLGLPISFDGVRPPLRKNPPGLGEDTHLILGEGK